MYCALALTAYGAGVFEALGTTPRELSQPGISANVESLALLPLSADERRELLAGWLAPALPNRPLLASQWLEFCGQPEAALKVLRDVPDFNPDPLQLTRLLYRNGQHEAAAAAFAESQQDLPCGPFAAYPPPKLEALLRPLVARGEWEETARFLAWLQPQCTISEWRSSVLSARIDLALQQGTVAGLFADLAKESAVTRMIADNFLDLGAAATLSAPTPGTSVADIAWCLEVDACTPELAPVIESIIGSGMGTPAQRRELFRQLARYFRGSADRNRLLVLWMAREEEFIAHFTALATSGIGQLPVLPLCELAARRPHEPFLNYLAGCNNNEYSAEKIVGPARACLWRALDHGTLVARPLDPAQDPFQRPADYYRHSAATDPARFALAALSERADPELLHQHLTAHPEFAKLPVIDQFRYLKAAKLEIPAWELLRQIDWSQAANDSLGNALSFLVISYPSLRRPSAETWAAMFEIWPEILLGSPTKSAAQIAAHSNAVFRYLGDAVFRYLGPPGEPPKRDFYRVWLQRLQAHGGEFTNEVLQGCWWLLSADPNAVAVRAHLGLSPADPLGREAADRRTLESRLDALNWFIGPGISGFPVGYARDDGHRFVGDDSGLAWFREQPGRDKELLWLSHRFPGLRQVIDSSRGFPQQDSLATALRLRSLLPVQCPQAIPLDLAIHRKLVNAPPDASDRAAKHIDALLATRNEPDFVLFRASAGVSMRHGERPRNPAALLELGSLGGAPVSVRRAAADLLSGGQAGFPKERISELQAAGAALGIGTSLSRPGLRWTNPDVIPPGPREAERNPTRIAENLARARQNLAECPDAAESAELIARSLGRDGDLADLHAALGVLRKLDTGRFIDVLSQPEIFARFAQPGLAGMAALFSIPQYAMPPKQYPDALPVHPLRSMHNDLFKQDPAMAALFRKLLLQQHWFPSLTEDLARTGQTAAAVEWLAARLTAPPRESPACSPLRFPPAPSTEPPKPAGPDVLLNDLEVFTIVEHHLAPPLITALAAGNEPARHLTIAYLKVLENPTLEIYRQAFGPILAAQDAAAASALKKPFTDWLKRRKTTQPLAAAIAAEPPP
ncbi:MAG: hypothetical protein NTW21_15450 [Verrucomicrobia bacterium]|nr:hypothetical protein [Verrucomicrobiota bacterium]